VDFLFYSLILLGVVGILLVLARLPGSSRLASRQMELAEKASKRKKRQAAKQAASNSRLPQQEAVIRRELKKAPIPWGWPGSDVRNGAHHGQAAHGLSPGHAARSLRHWIDHLIEEKRTVDDDEYRQMNAEALRSMVEDRFGRTPQATRITYRKVKPPRLRDPSRPHDQEDNFPSGRTEEIVEKLSRQPGKPKVVQQWRPTRKAAGLENIKKPWGW
jgi:hypothetical protein